MGVTTERPILELEDRLRFESVLEDVSLRFVNLRLAEVDRET